jgi:hypothetical protein
MRENRTYGSMRGGGGKTRTDNYGRFNRGRTTPPTLLERGLLGPRSYKYAAPTGAVTRVPRRETFVPGQAQAGRARRLNFLASPGTTGGAKSCTGAGSACAARPAVQITCNNSARFPLYGVGGGVRPMNQSMSAMNRGRSTTRPAALAALAGPAFGRLGASAAAVGGRIAAPAAAFCRILRFRPSSQPKPKLNIYSNPNS